RDEVDVECPWAVGPVGVAVASGAGFEVSGEREPRVGVPLGVGGDGGDVVVGGLVVVAAPRRGLVEVGDGLGADRGEGGGQGGLAVAGVGAEAEGDAAHRRSPSGWAAGRARSTVTETSANWCAMGACGLWTVTVARRTRSSSRQAAARRSARVSMRLHGSPETMSARVSARAP